MRIIPRINAIPDPPEFWCVSLTETELDALEAVMTEVARSDYAPVEDARFAQELLDEILRVRG